MFYLGRQIDGPTNIIPDIFLWGGCLFVNCFKRSLMISLPDFVVEELLIWGFNPYGD